MQDNLYGNRGHQDFDSCERVFQEAGTAVGEWGVGHVEQCKTEKEDYIQKKVSYAAFMSNGKYSVNCLFLVLYTSTQNCA